MQQVDGATISAGVTGYYGDKSTAIGFTIYAGNTIAEISSISGSLGEVTLAYLLKNIN